MILLIDGYNILKQAMLKSEISDQERNTFISNLGKYCKAKGHKARLVFDGGPSDRAVKESLHGITVVYSGYRESADDYIKNYLDANKAFDILLVSSDRDICRFASRINIEQIDAKDFYFIVSAFVKSFVTQRVINNSGAIKISKSANSELDFLMQEGSKVVSKKLEDVEFNDCFPGVKQNKLTKKETKKLKKIKKL